MDDFIVKNQTSIEWMINDLATSSNVRNVVKKGQRNRSFTPSVSNIRKDICSPEFSTSVVNASNKLVNGRWQLELHPNTRSGIEIRLRNLIDVEVSVTFEISLFYLGNVTRHNEIVEGKLQKQESCGLEFYIELVVAPYGLSWSDIVDLKVVCTLSNMNIGATGVVDGEDDRQCKFTGHYESLLETGKFGDVTFNVGEKSMHLHKAILTSASEVFQAMFDHEMKEQKESVVDVVDVDFDVLKEMMRYIYERRVNGMEKIAAELFVVADRYAVEDLKRLCESKLVDQLNADNVLSRFELSVKYGMVNLKAKTLDFVVRNMKELTLKELGTDCKDELLNYISTKTISDPRP